MIRLPPVGSDRMASSRSSDGTLYHGTGESERHTVVRPEGPVSDIEAEQIVTLAPYFERPLIGPREHGVLTNQDSWSGAAEPGEHKVPEVHRYRSSSSWGDRIGEVSH